MAGVNPPGRKLSKPGKRDIPTSLHTHLPAHIWPCGNPEFQKKWENNLQSCTSNMMKLLIEEYKIRTGLVKKDIDDVYTKLKPFLGLSAFKDQEVKIKGRLDQVTIEILHKKEKSFGGTKCPFKREKPIDGNLFILSKRIKVKE